MRRLASDDVAPAQRRLLPGWLSERHVDRLLAATVLGAAVAEALGTGADASRTALLPLAVAQAALLLIRRSHVALAALGYVAVVVTHDLLTDAGDLTGVAWFAGTLIAYAAGRFAVGRHGLPELAVAIAGQVLLWLGVEGHIATDFVFPPLFMVAAWGVGRWVRWEVRLGAEVHEQAALVLERGEREREHAQSEERRRIAREMHDVIAHSVSVMVVQAGGARRILDREPSRAAEAAELIEQTGREALSELRTLLGVIDPAPERSGAPVPSLRRLDEVVARARDAGLPVEVRVDGSLDALPSGLDVAAYRIVQEALTNALRHAGPAATRVRVRSEPGALSLEVVNAPPADGGAADLTRPGGHGVVGMAERAALYGGEIDAGPTPDGGYAVRTRLELDGHRLEALAR